jgi:predicted Holliday junction resolvase-like endonuclease
MADEKMIGVQDNSTIIAKSGVIFRQEADRWGLLYDPERDFSFGLNPVSAFIWNRLDEKHTVSDIVIEVKKGFQTDADEVENDVKQFTASLIENELAVISGALDEI